METRVKREIYLFDPKAMATKSKVRAIRHVPGHEHFVIFETIDGNLAVVHAYAPNTAECVFSRYWGPTGNVIFQTQRTRRIAALYDTDWVEVYRRRHG